MKAVVLIISALAVMASQSASSRQPYTSKLKTARGYLSAHREAPNFIPDKGSGLEIMSYDLKDDRWDEAYIKPVNDGYLYRPNETVCFRIIGKGYVTPRNPTWMQPWVGSTFVFVNIRKLELLPSEAECVSRMKMDGS